MNIYEKLSKISSEITRVGKNLSIQAGKESYKAVGEGDVLNAVKPLEERYRIYSFPIKREIVDSNVFTKTKTYKDQTTETTLLFMRLKTTYRFVNIDDPTEFVDMETYGDGVDMQDKAPGKAMTYADKYALLKAYKVTTGDDPDQNGSENMGKDSGTSAPTMQQLQQLKRINRTIGSVAQLFGIDEKAVTASHVEDYLKKAAEFQKKKSEQVEKEAEGLFSSGDDE